MKKENLRFSALLNSFTSVLDYFVKIVVNFFLNPLMVSFLGTTYFGVWQIISQLNSYMATADIRAATSLKYMLARDRSTKNDFELKQVVSSAILSTFVFAPFYILIGTIIVWISPIVCKVDPSYYSTVRTATFVLVFSFILTQFFFIFESTLHGLNLAYKRIGVRAFITIIGGFLTYLALDQGYGIVGVAVVQLVVIIVTGLTFYYVVKKNVPWFGFVRVKVSKVMEFVKLSGWFMLLKFSDLFSNSIDMVILGFIAGPHYVANYAITKYSITASSGLIKAISTGSSIGISKFIGENNYHKLMLARNQLINIQWGLIIVVGSAVCLFNASFIRLWTDPVLFTGQTETLFLVLIALFSILSKTDSSIINSTLNIGRKIMYTTISGVIIVVFSFLLIPHFKVLGLMIAILLSVIFSVVTNAVLVARLMSLKNLYKTLFFPREIIAGILFLMLSNYIARYVSVDNWYMLFFNLMIALLVITPVVYFLIFSKNVRLELVDSIRKIRRK